MKHLRNISLSQYESFLELARCKYIKTEGGHAKYFRSDLNRPIIVQTHVNPVPEFIIKNALRSLGMSKQQFWDLLECKCEVVEKGGVFAIEPITT